MTTPPDDAAALFDLPPLPASPQSAEATTQDEEAALAVELALALESGGVADDAPDSRTKRRVKVSWPARMQLPDGRVIALKVRDVSEGGVGLTSVEQIPACTVVNFALAVPPLDPGGKMTQVKGTIKTTYTRAEGSEILCGGTWVQVPSAGLELVDTWIERLRLRQ